jgi:hypothetical protein
MIYETLERTQDRLIFQTHPRARRGRGVLYATAPWVVYAFLISIGFALAATDLRYLGLLQNVAWVGAGSTAVLSVAAFVFGRRAVEYVRATDRQIEVRRTFPRGAAVSRTLPYTDLVAFAVDPSVRSLGADNVLVAVSKTGERISIVEGEPHSAQIHNFAVELSRLSSLPFGSRS